MRRILAVLLAVFIMLSVLTSCNVVTPEVQEDISYCSMFVLIEKGDNYNIYVHKESLVMYVVSNGFNNSGTFTVMLDADGKPLLFEGDFDIYALQNYHQGKN